MKFAKRAMVDSKERREFQKEFWDENEGKGREVGSEIFGRFFENHDSSLLT